MGTRWLALCVLCLGGLALALGALGFVAAGSAGAHAARPAAAAALPQASGQPLPDCAGVMNVTLDPVRDGASDSRVVAASCSPPRAEERR